MPLRLIVGAVAVTALANAAYAADPDFGGAALFETRTIEENAVNSAYHTTLIAAVQAAGLFEALSGPGPFTAFAPVDDAFAALPALLMPQNKDMLTKVLTAHVGAGDLELSDLRSKVGSDGCANLVTLSGDVLSVRFRGDKALIY